MFHKRPRSTARSKDTLFTTLPQLVESSEYLSQSHDGKFARPRQAARLPRSAAIPRRLGAALVRHERRSPDRVPWDLSPRPRPRLTWQDLPQAEVYREPVEDRPRGPRRWMEWLWSLRLEDDGFGWKSRLLPTGELRDPMRSAEGCLGWCQGDLPGAARAEGRCDQVAGESVRVRGSSQWWWDWLGPRVRLEQRWRVEVTDGEIVADWLLEFQVI